MGFDLVTRGAPTGIASPSQAPELIVDTVNYNLWLGGVGNGVVPVAPSTVSKVVALAAVANNANVLTYTAAVTGLYRVDIYEVSSNTPTGATLPAVTVVYKDADTTGTITDTLASVGSVNAANVTNVGSFTANVAAGGTIVVATTSYAAGSGTALAFNIKVRVTYLG